MAVGRRLPRQGSARVRADQMFAKAGRGGNGVGVPAYKRTSGEARLRGLEALHGLLARMEVGLEFVSR